MPSWVVSIFLPYIVPILVQGLSPIITEYVKLAANWLGAHLPSSMMVVVAATVAEGVNQGSAYLAGASLPPGVGAIISIFLNEVGNDFRIQPPTPGVRNV